MLIVACREAYLAGCYRVEVMFDKPSTDRVTRGFALTFTLAPASTIDLPTRPRFHNIMTN